MKRKQHKTNLSSSAGIIYAGKPCGYPDHGNQRYVANNTCVVCAKLAVRRALIRRAEAMGVKIVEVVRRPDAEARRFAKQVGYTKYASGYPCTVSPDHGDTRYSSTGMCVVCARAKSNAKHAEIRAAKEALKPVPEFAKAFWSVLLDDQ